MKITLLLFLSAVLSFHSGAQSYGASLGLRLGNDASKRTVGLTGQYRLSKFVTLEGILQSDFNNNTTGHVMLERHRRILTKRLNFYVGTGLSMGNEVSERKDPSTREITLTYDNPTVGVDLVFGTETTVLGYNISADYKPNFNLIGRNPWYTGQVGISVRQVVIQSGAQKKRQRQRARSKRQKEREKDRKDEDPWFKDWYERNFKKDK